MARVGLKDKLQAKAPELFKVLYDDYRPVLDSRITILDLSYEALKVNVYQRSTLSSRELEAYNKVYSTLTTVVREYLSKRTYNSLEDPSLVDYFTEKNKRPYPILIDNGSNDFFVVGKNFDAIRSLVTNAISRDSRMKASRFGESSTFADVLNKKGVPSGDVVKTTRSKVDIGHIPSEGNENLVSPLELKISQLLNVAQSSGNSRVVQAANKALKQLYDIQANITYNFKNTTPEAVNRAQSSLGSLYVVVTLHTAKKNNEFSQIEKKIYDKLVAEVALSVGVTDLAGSNTIIEDIVEHIVTTIKKGKSNLKKHTAQTGTITTNLSRKISTLSSKLVVPKQDSISKAVVLPSANLLALLNAKLYEQIQKNMGTGNETKVLNFRSGRFAESARVERISQSREGMVSAFYSYMRNPYGTFSEGGKQQYPRSRDPKALISKSIREIGATMVGNRMRAVLL